MIPLLKMRMKKLQEDYNCGTREQRDKDLMAVLFALEDKILKKKPEDPAWGFPLYSMINFGGLMSRKYEGLAYVGTLEWLKDAMDLLQMLKWSCYDDGSFCMYRFGCIHKLFEKASKLRYYYCFCDCSYQCHEEDWYAKQWRKEWPSALSFEIKSVDICDFYDNLPLVTKVFAETLNDENWELKKDPLKGTMFRDFDFDKAFSKYFTERKENRE